MLAKRIIPCLDVRDGKVVKGVNFVGIKEVGDPVECAIEYDRQGADEICFLDITATHEGRGTMVDVVSRTAKHVFVPLTVGGGIRTVEDFRAVSYTHLGKYQDSRAAQALLKLPRLFGGSEVFEKAYELFDENGARESLDYLKGIYEYLQTLGLGDKVIIDLGLVNLAEYYTDLIFRGYFRGIGEQVLSGGRYDTLIKEFGEDHCSVGFCINVDLASQKVQPMPEAIPEVLVFAPDMKFLSKAVHHRRTLEDQGVLTENCVFDTMEEAFDYAKMRGIPKVHLVGEDITVCLTRTTPGK